MTKAEWIDVIKNTMAKVDEQGIYRRPLIERHIQSVYEQMFNELYVQKPRGIWGYVKKYSEVLSEEVSPSTGITPPRDPIDLPRPSKGLFRFVIDGVASILTDYQGYLHVADSDFDTAEPSSVVRVATFNHGVLLINFSAPLAVGVTLLWWMIPKFTSMTLEEEVIIPGGAEDHFIDRIIDTIRHFRPTDLINDNTIQ